MQSLPIPAISVWKVVCLPNGDIAAGASDGKVWIFTSNSKRFADETLNVSRKKMKILCTNIVHTL